MTDGDTSPDDASDTAGSGRAHGTAEPRAPFPSVMERVWAHHAAKLRQWSLAHPDPLTAPPEPEPAPEPEPPAPARATRTAHAGQPGRVLRWLPASLQRLYRRLAAARPYARKTRPRPIPPDDERPSSGQARHYRLEIAYDAFCEHRPPPKKLFRANPWRRDLTSWCDAPNSWTGRRKPRCHHCERAHAHYIAACSGDWKAEVALFKLARRGAVRLLAERREYREQRRQFWARHREEVARNGPNPMPRHFVDDLWPMIAHRGSLEGWHHRDRREVERGLVRAHARHLRRETQRRRERLRDLHPEGCDSAKPASHQPATAPVPAPAGTGETQGQTADAARPTPAPPTPPPAVRPPPPPPPSTIKIGAARWTIPPARRQNSAPAPAQAAAALAPPPPAASGARGARSPRVRLACLSHDRRSSTRSMCKPLIGVTLDSEQPGGYSKYPWYALRNHYADAVAAAGGLPVALPHHPDLADDYLDRIDALIVTGGAFDVDPALYGDAGRHATVTLKAARTDAELALLRGALARAMPVLGICGGQQLLAVALGGTLIQHIPDVLPAALAHEQPNARHEPGHSVAIRPGSLLARITGQHEMQVNSSHHQAVRDAGPHAVVSATAPDGVIEAIEDPSRTFCLGVQWHPEFHIDPGDARIFAAFIAAARPP